MDKQAGRLLYTGAGLANWVGAISVWEQSSGHQHWVGGGYSGHFLHTLSASRVRELQWTFLHIPCQYSHISPWA